MSSRDVAEALRLAADRGIELTEILDPASGHRWLIDLEFLTSSWLCTWGAGCRGIHISQDPSRLDGCCTDGAHLADGDDFLAVSAAVPKLDPASWQFAARARRKGWFKRLPDGTIATRVVDQGCIFLNRPGFRAGPGCALHAASIARGEHPLLGKPTVCWELPLREVLTEDGHGPLSILRRWLREDFGPEGALLAWWCTDAIDRARSSEASVATTLAAELRVIVGGALHSELQRRVRDRLSAAGNRVRM